MSAASTIIKAFNPYLSELTLKEIFDIGVANKLPSFSQRVILQLCTEMYLEIKTIGPVLRLSSPLFVIGDIHGNIHDLIRIINDIPSFYETQILFLGDYVDRGSYSLDVVSLLFALKVKYPHNIHLLRGNHEFEDTNSNYGFKDEVLERYDNDDQIYSRVNEIFNYLPIAAIIDGSIFCVHGGISPLLHSIRDVEIIALPLVDCKQEMISDLMWSDPDSKVNGFLGSKRGRGKTFGVSAVKQFFKDTGFKRIIRGHQCMQFGIGSFHNGTVTTVFSTSYYSSEENCAAYLEIGEGSVFETHRLKPNRYITRPHAAYYTAIEVNQIGRSGSITLQLQPTDPLFSGVVTNMFHPPTPSSVSSGLQSQGFNSRPLTADNEATAEAESGTSTISAVGNIGSVAQNNSTGLPPLWRLSSNTAAPCLIPLQRKRNSSLVFITNQRFKKKRPSFQGIQSWFSDCEMQDADVDTIDEQIRYPRIDEDEEMKQ